MHETHIFWKKENNPNNVPVVYLPTYPIYIFLNPYRKQTIYFLSLTSTNQQADPVIVRWAAGHLLDTFMGLHCMLIGFHHHILISNLHLETKKILILFKFQKLIPPRDINNIHYFRSFEINSTKRYKQYSTFLSFEINSTKRYKQYSVFLIFEINST